MHNSTSLSELPGRFWMIWPDTMNRLVMHDDGLPRPRLKQYILQVHACKYENGSRKWWWFIVETAIRGVYGSFAGPKPQEIIAGKQTSSFLFWDSYWMVDGQAIAGSRLNIFRDSSSKICWQTGKRLTQFPSNHLPVISSYDPSSISILGINIYSLIRSIFQGHLRCYLLNLVRLNVLKWISSLFLFDSNSYECLSVLDLLFTTLSSFQIFVWIQK